MILGAVQLALAMALVGVNVPVAKQLAEALPIACILFLRCLIACGVLLPLVRAAEPHGARPAGRLLLSLFGQAMVGTALFNVALLSGLRRTSALEAGLVLAALPAVMALGAWLWLREAPGLRGWVSVGLAVLAMTALNAAGADSGTAGSLHGNALVFAAVVAEAAYALLAKSVSGRLGALTATLWMQVFSVLLTAPFAVPALLTGAAARISTAGWGLLLFHALTSSVVSLVLWYRGLRRAPMVFAGVSAIFLPAAAAVTAMLLFNERATAAHGAGFALMALSVLAAAWPKRRLEGARPAT